MWWAYLLDKGYNLIIGRQPVYCERPTLMRWQNSGHNFALTNHVFVTLRRTNYQVQRSVRCKNNPCIAKKDSQNFNFNLEVKNVRDSEDKLPKPDQRRGTKAGESLFNTTKTAIRVWSPVPTPLITNKCFYAHALILAALEWESSLWISKVEQNLKLVSIGWHSHSS